MAPWIILLFVGSTAAIAGIGGGDRRFTPLLGNTSVLPSGWIQDPVVPCLGTCPDILFGPTFTDATSMTIESCVAFCNQQGQRLAGLLGPQCVCSNVFRPGGNCFESDSGQCTIPGLSAACPGNPVESCGGLNTMPPVYNMFRNEDSQFFCSDPTWPGGAALVAGQWRFSYFYNDSITARALGRNAVNLPVPVPRGNMTSAICTTACGNAGFTLAGVEFADECYCGNAIENNAAPISALQHCDGIPTTFIPFPTTGSALMACTGNAQEFCGGPDIISIYTLPGTGIIPLIPFNEDLGGQCTANNCVGST